MLLSTKNVPYYWYKPVWTRKLMYVCVFLIATAVQATASVTYSPRDAKFSLDLKSVTVADVLAQIEKETPFYFTYNNKDIDTERKVSISMQDVDIDGVMKQLFANEGVRHIVIDDKQILLYKDQASALQGIAISGTVTDDKGEPMPGVNVSIKGTSTGVATDGNGKYTIMVPNISAVLVFSFIGYTKTEEPIGDRRRIDVKLLEDTQQLEEVVVVGYQTIQKRFASGSVASVSSKELSMIPSTSFSSMLAGKTTGLMSMNMGGAPGAAGAIVIRGNSVVSGTLGEANQFSNPLYVIDGVPTTLEEVAGYGKTNNDFLASLNMEDIESIDILKDASAAAIYGSRGANGVIIIKTKTGRPGKMQVTAKATFGVTMRPNLMKTPVGSAERNMKMQLVNRSWGYKSLKEALPIMLTDSLNPSFNNNMDYQGLFYQTGLIQDYAAAINGGTEELNYRFSLGFTNEDGIINNTGLKRYTTSLNVSQQPWKRVRNQTIISLTYTDRQPGAGDANSRGNFPVKPSDMNSSLFYVTQDQYDFLKGSLNDYYRTDRTIYSQITDMLNVDIWNGISFNSQVSATFTSNKRNQYQPRSISKDQQGHVNYDYDQRMAINAENYLSYTKDLAQNHNLNVLLGTSYEFNQNESNYLSSEGGSGDMIKTVVGYSKDKTDGSSYIFQNKMLSYWARLGYRFMERYQLDLNLRRDASSRFGKGNRWASFPSVAVMWIFSEEPFLDFTNDWLTFGKLRYSVGKNGKQFADDYLRYNMYVMGYNPVGYNDYGYWFSTGSMSPKSYNGIQAVIPDFSKLADNNLSWEESVQHNAGIEFEFFNSRLYVTGEYYVKNTKAMLFDVQFPDYTGFDLVKSNVAGIRNNGYEIMIDAHLFPRNNDFTTQVTFGLSRNTNTITRLPNNNRDYYADGYGYTVGKPGPLFYGFIYDGVLQSMDDLAVNPFTGQTISLNKNNVWGKVEPGYFIYKDVNGNYLVSDAADEDQVLTDYDPNPKIAGNLNLRFGYKGWQLMVNSYFVFGRDIYDEASTEILSRYDWTNWDAKGMINVPDYDFWTPTNTSGYYPSILPQASGVPQRYAFRGNSTMWWEDGSFWKINDITLAYNFKQPWMNKIGMDRLYVYLTAYNVWQWQASDKVIDASMVDSRGHVISDGYPMPRKYVMGVNLTF